MVTGIRVEITGEEIRTALDHRIDVERQRAERWKYEAARPLESHTIDKPVIPTHICMNSERRSLWRAERLVAIRERIRASEVYLINRRELEFLRLLPPKPALVGPNDIDDEVPEGFIVERVETGTGPDVTCIRNTRAVQSS